MFTITHTSTSEDNTVTEYATLQGSTRISTNAEPPQAANTYCARTGMRIRPVCTQASAAPPPHTEPRTYRTSTAFAAGNVVQQGAGGRHALLQVPGEGGEGLEVWVLRSTQHLPTRSRPVRVVVQWLMATEVRQHRVARTESSWYSKDRMPLPALNDRMAPPEDMWNTLTTPL